MINIITNFITNPFNIAVLVLGSLSTLFLWKHSNRKKSRQLRNYLPNIWTSLGILGTFASIVSTFRGNEVDWSNIDQLVTNIVPAFETSIIGIIGAIATSICAKVRYANEDFDDESEYVRIYKMMPEQHLAKINEKISDLIYIIKTQNENVLEESKRQHEEIMAESQNQRSLAEKMMREFTSQLKEFYDKLYDEEKQHMQEITDHYLSGINQIIMSTHGTIKDKFETLFKEHAESIQALMANEENKFIQLADEITTKLNAISTKIISTISDVGMNEIGTLGEITDNQKEQLQTIVNDNKEELSQIVKICKDEFDELRKEAKKKLDKTVLDFTSIIDTLGSQFKNVSDDIPVKLEQLKQDMVHTIESILTSKFLELSESHGAFINGLLSQINEFDKRIASQAKEDQKKWSNAINAELERILKQMDTEVNDHIALMKDTAAGLNSDLTTLKDSLTTATNGYAGIARQITSLVNALKKETNATEVYANSVTATNTQLTAIQSLLTDIANKNLQLRQELAQWKRTHKHVKVDTENGIKECPNCKAENPIDASYCRKCATSFWECEPVSKTN